MFNSDDSLIYEKYFDLLLESSKQNIVNLGYPKIIASIIYNKFGKNSFIIAKWIKETNNYKAPVGEEKRWWYYSNRKGFFSKELGLVELLELYESSNSLDNYIKKREEMGLHIDKESMDELDMDEVRNYIMIKMDEKLMEEYIFTTTLLKAILSNRINNMKEYSKLSFDDALERYNEKNVFGKVVPLRVYNDGYRWIDVGRKCELIQSKMKNCGSVGLMSRDKDATMISLFDKLNRPHVIVTYSPSEHRISGIQGIASSVIKSEYHDYVLDLADFLEANIDYHREKSKLLAIKSMLRGNYRDIEVLYSDDYGDQYISVVMNDGRRYVTDFDNFISYDNIDMGKKDFVDELRDAFRSAYRGNDKNILSRKKFLDLYDIPIYLHEY